MTHYQAISANKNKSFFIMSLFMTFIVVSVYIMARGLGYGLDIVGIALIVSGVTSFASYYWSDKIILSMAGARKVTKKDFFDFFTVTENLAMSQRMPMPALYVIEDTAMNAFATGRDPEHAVVCATTGLLSRLNRSEVEAVVAHELSHIKNYDIRLMSIVSILVGLIALVADWMLRMSFWGGRKKSDDREGSQLQMVFFFAGIVLALLSPVVAELIKLAVSRNREFLADASCVGMTRHPGALADALKKIAADSEPLEAANKATAHLYFSDPLKNVHGAVGMFAGLFQTHPPVKERIAALEKMR